MKSVPEVWLKKTRSEWTLRDIWVLRLTVTVTGFLVWIFLRCLLHFLSPWNPGHQGLFRFLTVLYPILLLVLACRALPLKSSAPTD